MAAIAMAGCISGMQASPYSGAVMGKQIYNMGNLSHWKYAVTMSAGGANSTWNMTVNNSRGPDGEMYMTVGTVGNGMDILYDVWWNATTYGVDRMHARGWIGDYFQDRNVSPLQILTLPDTGLNYYFVPFQYVGSTMVRGLNGQVGQLGVYSATDNKGFSVTYWAYPGIPLPLKVQLSNRDFNITMMLQDYK